MQFPVFEMLNEIKAITLAVMKWNVKICEPQNHNKMECRSETHWKHALGSPLTIIIIIKHELVSWQKDQCRIRKPCIHVVSLRPISLPFSTCLYSCTIMRDSRTRTRTRTWTWPYLYCIEHICAAHRWGKPFLTPPNSTYLSILLSVSTHIRITSTPKRT